MNKYDVIIIGGGPAGLHAASNISSEHKVLIIEKDDEIGEPVLCAEGISNNTLKTFFKEENLPFIRNRFSKVTIRYKEKSATIEIPDMGLLVDRSKFDKYLAEKAIKKGSEIKLNTLALDAVLNEDHVTVKTNNGDFEAKMVIAADGVESYIGHKLGLETVCQLNDMYSCYQYVISDNSINDDEIVFDFSPEYAPGGYVWAFPRGEKTANFGLGINAEMMKSRPVEVLRAYKEKFYPEAKIIRAFSGCVSVNPLSRIYGERVLIAGDAARYADPITGGGIDNALRTGGFAGQVANIVLKEDNFSLKKMSIYHELVEKDNWYSIKRQLQLKKMMSEMTEEELDRFFTSSLGLFDGKKVFSSDFYSTIYSLKSTIKTTGLLYNLLGSLMKDKYLLKIIMRLLWQ
ncbi:MAG: NAD(P)/FAD-dependent oxidoreductase [bacterium]|nr:NAD(P)/FAD-dependent oxidoreductase [bacterium]